MIAYVEQPPTIEQRNGHFVVTFVSGSDQIAMLMSRNSLMKMGMRARVEAAQAFVDEAEVVRLDGDRAAGRAQTKAGNGSAQLL